MRPGSLTVAARTLAPSAALLALAFVCGCAGSPPAPTPLNSERIAQRFGSFGIEVLVQDDELRISSLYSNERGRRVCRTFALVSYPASVPPALAREHRRIRDGGSLGAVFKAGGWQIAKRHRYLGQIDMEPRFTRLEQLMNGITASRLAVHVYDFSVSRGDDKFDYATIAEIHHPDYLTLAELRAIYAGGSLRHARIDPVVSEILRVARRFWSDPVQPAVATESPSGGLWRAGNPAYN